MSDSRDDDGYPPPEPRDGPGWTNPPQRGPSFDEFVGPVVIGAAIVGVIVLGWKLIDAFSLLGG